MASSFKVPTPIYHMTHIDNLASIVAEGGLFSHGHIRLKNLDYIDISHQSVQDKRGKVVPCAAGGTLHDYVPFYFNPRNPMQYSIKMGNVDQYQTGISELIFLYAYAQDVKEEGTPFSFTDRHAVLRLTEFYTDLGDLSKVDWKVMSASYWNDYIDGGEKRQAEFLVYNSVQWNLVSGIGVYDERILQKVQNIVVSSSYKPAISVERKWFF